MKEVNLVKEIPNTDITFDGAMFSASSDQWNVVQVFGTAVAYYESYIDMAGHVRDHKTFFPAGFEMQEGGVFNSTITNPVIIQYDVVSSTPINAVQFANTSGAAIAPGMMRSFDDFQNILWGQMVVRGKTSNVVNGQVLSIIDRSNIGSGSPSASDRLYVYRFVLTDVAAAPNEAVRIPSSRIVGAGLVSEEPDLEYIWRLRRSYELQQEPDVD